ncbi:hypothetical protein OOZ15_12045 [Galbibacter sp. EGI 63066]|uniref:hypothetical protein n=1 Tax=Galbibacter sp. EGI 63066 TaxID=2993559 RepID=UPI0022487977|nr:hypothetical protein [Galbibacter sp. EGI 63066]MCX2680676.1 hypothetical protein [Galbibacter sp. EGI 63066]
MKKKRLFTSSFIIHFFFLTIVFIGPCIYYELGFTVYSNSFDWVDVITFEKYSIFVFSCTLIYSYFLSHTKKTILNSLFSNYSQKNKSLLFLYFIFWYSIVALYLLIYFKELPVIKFIFTGILPERLDKSESVKFFYTLSSIFMVFIPSGYFYFITLLKGNLTKFLLLLFVIFILTSGGHKGLTAFFIIFALMFSGYKFNLKYILILGISVIGLLSIYTVTKGKKINKETLVYLLESPPRRFFVTQGSAFITRISMDRKNLYKGNVHEYQVIKNETYKEIYPHYKTYGAAPTIFMGDMHVRYGPVITGISYIIFLLFCFPIIKGLDNMPQRKLHLWWNLFIFFFLLGMTEISMFSSLRLILTIFNLFAILILPKLKLNA